VTDAIERVTIGVKEIQIRLSDAVAGDPHSAELPKALFRRRIWRFVSCLAQQTLEVP
jgi:hypothetical protein